jgi:hypothetical protein
MQPNGIDAGGFQAHNRAMPAGFELKGKVLDADFRANEKFQVFTPPVATPSPSPEPKL